MQENLVSIILPCFNEKGNIIPLIQEIREVLANQNHEIIVVDDNSPDGTYQAVLDLGFSNVRALLRTQDPGFAKSIRAGIDSSKGNIIVIMDSDFNHEPKYLPVMIDNCRYYNVVSGSRFVYGGNMDSRFRHLSSWTFNIFIRLLTKNLITDSLFGYFAIHRSVLEQVNYDDVFWGYGDYCIRLMYYLQKKSFSILQIPVVLGQRKYGEGNKKLLKTLFKYLKATLHLALSSKKESSNV